MNIINEQMEEIQTIKCNFCDNRIECPEEMKNAEIHSCFECYEKMRDKLPKDESKIHVEMTDLQAKEVMPEVLIGVLLEDIFPELWKENKEEIKEMSRRESSMMMFVEGAKSTLELMRQITEEDDAIQDKIKVIKTNSVNKNQ